jgi:hypothetical protein
MDDAGQTFKVLIEWYQGVSLSTLTLDICLFFVLPMRDFIQASVETKVKQNVGHPHPGD